MTIPIYLEVGKSKTIAGALDWPGWCRSGADEPAALQALHDYRMRYARALASAGADFQPPAQISDLAVVERLAGNATTDFGAPGMAPAEDGQPVTPSGLERHLKILRACWQAFDLAAELAAGRELRKGPRGGGRELAKIVEHVYEVDEAYLKALGGKPQPRSGLELTAAFARLRREMEDALAAAVRGEIAPRGPRGGLRWSPRYFVRRQAWHELDHAWEIEDRVE